jgi:hypothetical protein
MLERKGIAVATGLPGSIGPGQVTLFFAGDVPHRDFMSRAWTNEPLAWVLGNVAAEVLSGGR